jgi:hypothetical protein
VKPDWRRAEKADFMRPDDPVLGLSWNRQAWALPWWIVKNHHVANLELGGRDVLVTFCEMCSSAAAFVRRLDDGRLFFFESVGIYNGSILISDTSTESLWSPFNATAVHGPLKGTVLKRLPLYQCHWSEWKSRHPETMVPFDSEDKRHGHGAQDYPGKDRIGTNFIPSLLRPIDERLPGYTLVLGVKADEAARAYPIAALQSAGAPINDAVGTAEIVVFHEPGTYLATAFSRRLGRQTLTFFRTQDGALIDRNTSSRWRHTGEAYTGPLRGKTLAFVDSGVEEWYIWAAYHPDTTIFETNTTPE